MMWAVLYVLADQLIGYTCNYHRYLVVFVLQSGDLAPTFSLCTDVPSSLRKKSGEGTSVNR